MAYDLESIIRCCPWFRAEIEPDENRCDYASWVAHNARTQAAGFLSVVNSLVDIYESDDEIANHLFTCLRSCSSDLMNLAFHMDILASALTVANKLEMTARGMACGSNAVKELMLTMAANKENEARSIQHNIQTLYPYFPSIMHTPVLFP